MIKIHYICKDSNKKKEFMQLLHEALTGNNAYVGSDIALTEGCANSFYLIMGNEGSNDIVMNVTPEDMDINKKEVIWRKVKF